MKNSATQVSEKNGHAGPMPSALPNDAIKSGPANENISAADASQLAAPQIRLLPFEGSDRPVLANYTTLEVTPGLVYLDFGFIEPSVIEAVQNAIQTKTPLPERITGRMAARVAMGLDHLHALHKQLNSAISGIENMAHRQMAAYAEAMDAQKKQ